MTVDNFVEHSGALGADNCAPVTLVQNLFRVHTTAASTEESGRPVSNAYRLGSTANYWSPASSNAQWIALDAGAGNTATHDAFGIAAHNLAAIGADIKAQYSSDTITWLDATATYSPTSNRPFFVAYPAQTARYARLLITAPNGTIPIIGVAAIGASLKWERGIRSPWSDPYDNVKMMGKSLQTEGGHILGISTTTKTAPFTMTLDHLTPSWVAGNARPFGEAALRYPFFLYPNVPYSEPVYAWLDKPAKVAWSSRLRQRVTYSGQALWL